ncbi:type IV toxin-antitoxin system AbiEi family antitoxin domain-containing protein [Actinoplanes xinjiangensis]|uniref:type IV toxin-antitoxin system AbiEi family antitoxin domain-containing protein n=1 Tax=Actinoplanes xinjiangensis TaxID=512350 RepID=UPI00343D0D38
MPAFTPDPDTPLGTLLRFQHGVISWRQARRHLSESAVHHRVVSGRWRRMHLGVYLTYSGPVTRIQRWWIASLAVGNGRPALLAGPTALRLHGLRVPEVTQPVHLLLPAHLTDRDPPPGVVVHRTRRLSRDDACLDMSPPCTTVARSLVDAAQWAFDDAAAISMVAATFQQRLVTLEQVRTVLGASRRVRRRSVIEAAVADAGGGSESAYEIEFIRLCRLAGLPAPSRQAVRRDRSGRNRYRDVFFDPWQVQVEIDGSQHMEARGWFADMRSGNEIAISGVRLLRFPGWAVRHRPDEVVADVRAALEAAGWRGGSPATPSRRAA